MRQSTAFGVGTASGGVQSVVGWHNGAFHGLALAWCDSVRPLRLLWTAWCATAGMLSAAALHAESSDLACLDPGCLHHLTRDTLCVCLTARRLLC